MTAGKYFNRNVLALDDPHIGQVIRETNDQIVVFGDRNKRYDIPISEIKFVSKNVLVGLNSLEIEQKYRVDRNSPLPDGKFLHQLKIDSDVALATYEGKYDKSLFNKGVRLENEDHVGHVMKETNDTIVIFGHGNDRYDVPKSKIIAVGRNVILGLNWPLLLTYKVNRDRSLSVFTKWN
jgi:sporulation protein YlmC with PRC-barrel domain